jgi:hypothetical protein
MTIYNVTVNERCGGPSVVHAVDADRVQVGRNDPAIFARSRDSIPSNSDTVLRFYRDDRLIAAFYDWDWFCEGVLTSKPSA